MNFNECLKEVLTSIAIGGLYADWKYRVKN